MSESKGGPHRFPMPAPDGEIIAWKCRACGGWVSEYGGQRDDCPVDWRASMMRETMTRLAASLSVDLGEDA